VDQVEIGRKRPIPSAELNLLENGATCDSVFNTWRWTKEQRKRLEHGEDIVIEGHTEDPRAKRLDYIFVGDGGQTHSLSTPKWTIQSARVGMTERHPTLRCSLSDHFSVEATVVRESPARIEGGGEENPPNASLTSETYDRILDMISAYIFRDRFQRCARLYHFLVSLLVSIACFIGVCWSPRNFISFILVLVSTLNMAAGVIDGLIGGLFMGSEIRALKEFEWEVRNARSMAVASAGGK
jgi:sphingomyelin phosphodiesterase 2